MNRVLEEDKSRRRLAKQVSYRPGMKGGRSGGRTVSGRWQGYVWCDMLISETSLKIFSEQFSQFNWDNSRTNTAIMHCRLRPRRPSPLAQWTRPVGAAIVTSSGTLCNQYDAAGALVCARRRNDVIRCNVRLSTCLRMVHYVQIWRHPYNRKYITYRNAAGEGRGHVHRHHAQNGRRTDM